MFIECPWESIPNQLQMISPFIYYDITDMWDCMVCHKMCLTLKLPGKTMYLTWARQMWYECWCTSIIYKKMYNTCILLFLLTIVATFYYLSMCEKSQNIIHGTQTNIYIFHHYVVICLPHNIENTLFLYCTMYCCYDKFCNTQPHFFGIWCGLTAC